MRKDFIKKIITSQADSTNGGFVEYGYGQVEPNHLANQATKQSYGQLPAAKAIDVLENGQFAKYDYANGEVNFTGKGEWMLVWNEIKLYREEQLDCEFALVKEDYAATVYSPFGGPAKPATGGQVRDYSKVIKAGDPYEIDYADTANGQPFKIDPKYTEQLIDTDKTSAMVPRLMKTEVGDIITTNMILESTVSLKQELAPNTSGILAAAGDDAEMVWQVVKVYTMPDGQQGAKIMRIK